MIAVPSLFSGVRQVSNWLATSFRVSKQGAFEQGLRIWIEWFRNEVFIGCHTGRFQALF